MQKKILLIFLAIVSCQKAKKPIEPSNPSEAALADYDQTVGALVTGFTQGGFGVVSRNASGDAEHLGEALIWGGTALWAIDCKRGAPISQAMAKMIMDHDGAMIRVEPLGEYEGGREITLDGAIGAFLGISRRVADCGEADLWHEPMAKMLAFQEANDGRLHPNTPPRGLPGEFRYLRDLVAWSAGAADEPGDHRKEDLEKIVGGWALAVRMAHDSGKGSDACFRVNLGLDAILAIETHGKAISAIGRDEFCANTDRMDIPTVDHWCGRKSINGYLANYQPDLWEYRHQRCGAWESPDGAGNASPRLDKLMGFVMAHSWKALQAGL